MINATNVLYFFMNYKKERISNKLDKDFVFILSNLEKRNLPFNINRQDIDFAITNFIDNNYLSVRRGSIKYCFEEENISELGKDNLIRNLKKEEKEVLMEIISNIQ